MTAREDDSADIPAEPAEAQGRMPTAPPARDPRSAVLALAALLIRRR